MNKDEIALEILMAILEKDDSFSSNPHFTETEMTTTGGSKRYASPKKVAEAYNTIFQSLQLPALEPKQPESE